MDSKQHLEVQRKRSSNKHSCDVHLLVDGVTNDWSSVVVSDLAPFQRAGRELTAWFQV